VSKSQVKNFFGLAHGIQSKGSIWKRREGQPAIGIEVEQARGFLRLVFEKNRR